MPRKQLVQFSNERPILRVLPEEREDVEESLRRAVGFTRAELDEISDPVLLELRTILGTRGFLREFGLAAFTGVGFAALSIYTWVQIGTWETVPVLLLGMSAIYLFLPNRRDDSYGDRGKNLSFGRAGRKLIRSVGMEGDDRLRLKERAASAAHTWRRLGRDVGVDVEKHIPRIFELIGPDKTLPLTKADQEEVGVLVRTTLCDAARRRYYGDRGTA